MKVRKLLEVLGLQRQAARGVPRPCAAARERLEAYLDGDLEPAAAESVRRHLEGGDREGGCAACAGELRRAESVRAALRALPQESCPPAVHERVIAIARREAYASTRASTSHAAGPWRWLGTGTLAAAAAAALLWIGVRATDVPAPRPEEVRADLYSAEELERAEEELRMALGYVASISRRSGLALRDDVLVGEVIEPSAGALERAFAAATGAGREP